MYGRSKALLRLLFCLALIIQIAPAQQKDKRAEAERLPNKMKRTDPKQYAQMQRFLTVMVEMLLGRLGYGVGPFDGILDDHTKRALREYEKKRGLPETGDPMSYQTFVQVGEDRESLDREPVRLPTLFIFVDHWDMRDSLDAA